MELINCEEQNILKTDQWCWVIQELPGRSLDRKKKCVVQETLRWPESGRVCSFGLRYVKWTPGTVGYLSIEKMYLREDWVPRDDKWGGEVVWQLFSEVVSGAGKWGRPWSGKTWVVRSRSVTKEEEPHLDEYAVGCDVGINCLADSDVISES